MGRISHGERRTMMKIAVISDSGCGMSEKEAQERGIFVLPLQLIINDVSYRDGVDIQAEDLYDKLKEGALPKTSMPVMSDIDELFHRLKEEGYDHAIAIPLSTGLSSTTQSLNIAAQMEELPLTCIEVSSTCCIEKYVTIQVKALVDAGKSVEEIKALVLPKIASSGTLIYPNDLNHLKRGGRLTPVAASLATLLKIKPILKIDPSTQGRIDVEAKVRTEKKAERYVIENIAARLDKDKAYEVFIIDSDCREKALRMKEELAALVQGQDVHITNDNIYAVISSHTGLDCIAVQYIEKIDG